jgi:hypothetical protein
MNAKTPTIFIFHLNPSLSAAFRRTNKEFQAWRDRADQQRANKKERDEEQARKRRRRELGIPDFAEFT